MIAIARRVPVSDQWIKWSAAASSATAKLIADVASGRTLRIDPDLYKAQKAELMRTFHGKCAYCESAIIVDQTGDIDHFRPKAGVSDSDDRAITILRPDGSISKHPGYYWLAYEWGNLLPCCIACNRPSTRAGERAGKRNRFPVREFRANLPGEEQQEHPLLLNPYERDPSDHLVFDPTGIVGFLTDEGRVCIEVLGLNREGLPEERRSVYRSVQLKFFSVVTSPDPSHSDTTATMRELRDYLLGRRPYSAIGRRAITDAQSQVNQVSKAIKDP